MKRYATLASTSKSCPRGRLVLLSLLLGSVLALEAAAATRAPAKRPRPRPKPRPVHLVYHAETLEGETVASVRGDEPINPASVVKVATTLWALESLGPDHRFDTVISTRGELDPGRGILYGDLLVEGSGDPDFHQENAFLLAARLNQIGVREVRGALRINQSFWIGWEGGSERMKKDPIDRAMLMGTRLRKALDPNRWDSGARRAWGEFAARYGLPASPPPGVAVLNGVGLETSAEPGRVLLRHRSKPLVETLRRFNCYSNNDIERLESVLGSPGALARRLVEAWQVPAETVQLQTTSGLGTNRLTPRLVVRLLKALRQTTEGLGLPIESLLPVAGCDPGTLNHSFSPLCRGATATSVVAKTGTLTTTDGGTAVLAGFVNTARGEIAFCVAAPRAAGRLQHARRAEAAWIQSLLARFDGPRPRRCARPLGTSEVGAELLPPPAELVEEPAGPSVGG